MKDEQKEECERKDQGRESTIKERGKRLEG